MIPVTFYVFLSVIILPDGEVKSYTEHVVKCPTEELVLQMHVPRMESGEIKDWSASCGPIVLMFNAPTEEVEKLRT